MVIFASDDNYDFIDLTETAPMMTTVHDAIHLTKDDTVYFIETAPILSPESSIISSTSSDSNVTETARNISADIIYSSNCDMKDIADRAVDIIENHDTIHTMLRHEQGG